MPPLPRRDTARVILASPDDRVLLFRHLLPAPWSQEGWLTPGGAIDQGETPAQAAARELAEETGHRFTATGIGPAVAVDSGRWQAVDGTVIATTNWYFFVRVASARIDLTGLDHTEREDLLDYRWWTITDLRASRELVFPVGLANLTQQLLAGDLPAEPIRLPWA